MGPVFVMERSVAASQGFELAGLVLERNTSHSANWGCSCSEWHGGGTPLFLPSPYSCVCVCVCACSSCSVVAQLYACAVTCLRESD